MTQPAGQLAVQTASWKAIDAFVQIRMGPKVPPTLSSAAGEGLSCSSSEERSSKLSREGALQPVFFCGSLYSCSSLLRPPFPTPTVENPPLDRDVRAHHLLNPSKTRTTFRIPGDVPKSAWYQWVLFGRNSGHACKRATRCFGTYGLIGCLHEK